MEVDYKSISPELRDKLSHWEKNARSQKQVELLEKIAAKPHQVVVLLGDGKKSAEQTTADLTGLLTEIRDALGDLNGKEAPETPDYARPVVEAVSKLEQVLSRALRPQPAPQVNVNAPEVDLRGVEDLLKSDIPKAFEKAVKLIPKTEIPENDYSSLLDALERMSGQLESIDIATRLKVQGPGGSSSSGSTVTISGPTSAAVTSVGDTITSTQLIASNPNRKEVEFLNTSSAILYIKKGGGTASATSYTVYLNQGDYYSTDSKVDFSGVWSSDAGGLVLITENT